MRLSGFKHSQITRERLSKALKGNKNGLGNKSNTGRKLPKDQVEKIRNSKRGERNYLWKGESVSYSGLHHWLKREYGKPKECEICEVPKKRYTWANISGLYKRNINDYMSLCYSCHKFYDLNRLQGRAIVSFAEESLNLTTRAFAFIVIG